MLLTAALLTPAPAFAVEPDPSPTAFWALRGCDHWHRSLVAYKRTTLILKNPSPFTRAEGRRVRHYTFCVQTRSKARAVLRHVGRLKVWRRRNVCSPAWGNRALGKCMALRDYGWGLEQFYCLDELWGDRESGWSTTAHNSSSGAHGIPQALPGSKMGPGWWDDPVVQIRWGLGYIASRYGTPCGALFHSRSTGWY